MTSSILDSIKKSLGMDADYDHFDPDIMMSINSTFGILNQLGVGPEEGYSIESDKETWEEFIGTRKDLATVKAFVFLKVKLMFDPPSNSFLIDAITKQISELEWRITNQAVQKGVE